MFWLLLHILPSWKKNGVYVNIKGSIHIDWVDLMINKISLVPIEWLFYHLHYGMAECHPSVQELGFPYFFHPVEDIRLVWT